MRSLPMVQPVLRWRKACAVAGWDPIDDTSWHQMQAEGRGLMSSSLFLVYNRIITCSFNHQWYPDLLYTYFGPVCCIKSPSRLVTLGEAQGAWSNGEDGKKKAREYCSVQPVLYRTVIACYFRYLRKNESRASDDQEISRISIAYFGSGCMVCLC